HDHHRHSEHLSEPDQVNNFARRHNRRQPAQSPLRANRAAGRYLKASRRRNGMNWTKLFAGTADMALLASATPAIAQMDEGPGPDAYKNALDGKRVALVPM